MREIARCGVLTAAAVLFAGGAADSTGGSPSSPQSTSLRSFPDAVAAEPIGIIDPAGWGPAYRGGRLQQIASDPRGRLYVATSDPCQVLRLDPSGGAASELPGTAGSADACRGPWLSLSASRDGVLLGDGGLGRLRHLDAPGSEGRDADVRRVFDAASNRGRATFVYPGAAGYLVDILDPGSSRARPAVRLAEGGSDAGPLACQLVSDGAAGAFALWNPTRTVYHVGKDGEILAQFTLDPPDMVADLEARLRHLAQSARDQGLQASISPFVELLQDRDGRLAALYLFEGAAAQPGDGADAALYRFTADGRPVDAIHGLGGVVDAAFATSEELIGLQRDHQRLVRFRIVPRDLALRGTAPATVGPIEDGRPRLDDPGEEE